MASGLASANSITYGFDAATGHYTVTQTETFGSTPLTSELATFLGFSALGIGGGATYDNGDTSLDYQFTNTVSNFTVKNTDTQTDAVNFALQSTVTGDAGTTLTNAPSQDLKNSCQSIATAGFSINLSATCADIFNLVTGTQSIGAGATYTYPGTPFTVTLGISTGNGCGFGVTNNAGAGCAQHEGNDSQYSGSSSVAFGVDDGGNYTFNAANNGSNTDLTFNSTVSETAMAEITYEYTIPSGTPEPTTMALMGGALIGLGILGKRFKKS
jgi:hypothetical protein